MNITLNSGRKKRKLRIRNSRVYEQEMKYVLISACRELKYILDHTEGKKTALDQEEENESDPNKVYIRVKTKEPILDSLKIFPRKKKTELL